jgi:hypothetical protein
MKKIVVSLLLFCFALSIGLAQNKIKQYEYWLDSNLAAKQTVSIPPTACLSLEAVAVTGLTPGIHTLNLRFQDTNNRYSPVVTQRIDAFSATPLVNACEYWFDNAYAAKTTVSLGPSATFQLNEADLKSLANGFHRFNIRFSDASSKWSAVQTARIYKSAGKAIMANGPNAYRYWFDKDIAHAVTKSLSQSLLAESIDLTALPSGNNSVLNVQIQDAMGLWSAVQSMRLFHSGRGGAASNQILGYRYWMDNDFANQVYTNISSPFEELNNSLDLSAFAGSAHRLHLQFKDAQGFWSSVLTDTLQVVYTGLNAAHPEGFKLYPNPNHGAFSLTSPQTMDQVVLSVLNVMGEVVYRESFDQFSSSQIRLQHAGPGIYFLHLSARDSGKLLLNQKMVIK